MKRLSKICRNVLFFKRCCHFTNQLLSTEEFSSSGYGLRIYDTYAKEMQIVEINGKHVFVGSPNNLLAKIYICGPTVYDYSHLGHALTYIRFDLIRRTLNAYCGVNTISAMGITDIDDKIIRKANQEGKTPRQVSDFYYSAFLDDISALNITPPNLFLRVTDHVNDIVNYINRLQELGFAYRSEVTNDINFDSSKFPLFGKTEETDKSFGKKNPADFALWKASKPNEPFWEYKSLHGESTTINGRPGWHVECSVMGSGVFGPKIDFHFGGKDLIFPHHYNESLCCHAYHQLRSECVNEWSSYWLHSGHLIFDEEKMSKSLGNVLSIRDFLKNNDPNIFRLLCMRSHYRKDMTYSDDILQEAKAMDNSLKHFTTYLDKETEKLRCNEFRNSSREIYDRFAITDKLLKATEDEVIKGIADNFDFNRGLMAVLNLVKQFQAIEEHNLLDLLAVNEFFRYWIESMGLRYESVELNPKNAIIIEKLLKFRHDIRIDLLTNIVNAKANKSAQVIDVKVLKNLLINCDNIRSELKEYGIMLQDDPIKKSS